MCREQDVTRVWIIVVAIHSSPHLLSLVNNKKNPHEQYNTYKPRISQHTRFFFYKHTHTHTQCTHSRNDIRERKRSIVHNIARATDPYRTHEHVLVVVAPLLTCLFFCFFFEWHDKRLTWRRKCGMDAVFFCIRILDGKHLAFVQWKRVRQYMRAAEMCIWCKMAVWWCWFTCCHIDRTKKKANRPYHRDQWSNEFPANTQRLPVA